MDDYFKVNIEKELQKIADTDKNRAGLLLRWNNLQTTDLEEYLLGIVFPPSVDDWDSTIKTYEDELPLLRGSGSDTKYWFTSGDIFEMEFTDEFLTSPETKASILASIKLWHVDNYADTAKELLRKIEKYTNGTFTFNELEDEWSSFYIKVTMLLMIHYFEELPLVWQGYLLNSDFFHLAIMMNLNLESALRWAVESNPYIFDRKDFAFQYATFIYDNLSPIGIKPDGEEIVNNKFWIDLFRKFSKKKFDGISLINFLNDKENWKYCDIEDKMIIKEVLSLYVHLISGIYIFPSDDEIKIDNKQKVNNINLKSFDKPAINYQEIKQEIENKFSKDKDGDYEDIPGVLELLERIAKEQNDDKITELFFWDEDSEKFKWNI